MTRHQVTAAVLSVYPRAWLLQGAHPSRLPGSQVGATHPERRLAGREGAGVVCVWPLSCHRARRE